MSTVSVGLDEIESDAYFCMMLAPEQSRAARGWLEWSQEDLAKRARVSLSTVRDFEKGRRVPIPNNLEAIEKALEAGGIKLTFSADGAATGIKINHPETDGVQDTKVA
jgi:ribosome-binding protein aMBF1 (putative translation factor)